MPSLPRSKKKEKKSPLMGHDDGRDSRGWGVRVLQWKIGNHNQTLDPVLLHKECWELRRRREIRSPELYSSPSDTVFMWLPSNGQTTMQCQLLRLVCRSLAKVISDGILHRLKECKLSLTQRSYGMAEQILSHSHIPFWSLLDMDGRYSAVVGKEITESEHEGALHNKVLLLLRMSSSLSETIINRNRKGGIFKIKHRAHIKTFSSSSYSSFSEMPYRR